MDKQCMFCGQNTVRLEEAISPWDAVMRVHVTCTNCACNFMANFDRKLWERIKKIEALSQLGR